MSDKFEVRLGEEEPVPEFTFTSDGIGSAPIGDIIAIKAKSKNGKTFLAAIFAAVILGAEFGQLRGTIPNDSKVLFFDTEQNRPNTQALLERIHILRGWDEEHNDRIHVFALREMSLFQRIGYIEKKINRFKPTVVFIDGLADLIFDFNDIEQAQDLIIRISKLASAHNCAIFFILHTNKNDNNMKGHLGTLATQKCSDVFNIEKTNDDIFIVTETDCRNKPIVNFEFKIDGYGIPYYLRNNIETEERDTAGDKKDNGGDDNGSKVLKKARTKSAKRPKK